VLSFARSDEEQNKIRELIRGAMNDNRYENIVFIDASSTVLGAERFEQWADHAANEEYWRTKDVKLADEMARKTKVILEDWKTDVASSTFTVFSKYAKTGEPYGNASSVLAALTNIVTKKHLLSFDNAKVSEQMFIVSQLPSGAKCGITQTCGGVYQQSFVIPLMQGAWQIPEYWKSSPTLPLSKLKREVDDLVNNAFQREGRISIRDIFDWLIGQGFMPCNLYALLTGFLLKEYAIDTYRYSDGETGDRMNADKMAEIIGECMKHMNIPIPRYKDKYIEVMTKEQMAFIDFAKTVFGIADDVSIEQAAIRIRTRLKDLGFPI
jgi:hypothetical protein